MDMQSKQAPWQGRGLEHSVPVKRAMAERRWETNPAELPCKQGQGCQCGQQALSVRDHVERAMER